MHLNILRSVSIYHFLPKVSIEAMKEICYNLSFQEMRSFQATLYKNCISIKDCKS